MRFRGRGPLAAPVLAAAITLAGCAGAPQRVTVEYRAAGRDIATTVDSSAARYLIEREHGIPPLAATRRDEGWDAFIDGVLADETLATDPRRLAALAELVSVDFATAVFREQVNRRPTNRAFRARVDAVEAGLAAIEDERPLRTASAGADDGSRMVPPLPLVRLVLVPGWRYRSSPSNGADLQRAAALAQRLGLPWSRIETPEDGTVEENAERIAQWIATRDHDAPLVLVSASKGGPEVALALDRLRDRRAAQEVVAWINISGLVGGSPLADGSLTWPARLFIGALLGITGGSLRPVESMTVARSRERLANLRLPPHVLVLNYFAAPYSGELSATGALTYAFLRQRGPNDGLGLATDARLPGIALIEPGVDHFLADARLETRLEAVLRATLALAEERIAARGGAPLTHARGTLHAAQ